MRKDNGKWFELLRVIARWRCRSFSTEIGGGLPIMGTPVTYSWIPSTARVVLLDGFGPIPRGTLQILQPPLSWPVKDPTDTLDYVIDISEAIAGNEGDSIATLDVAISPNNPGDLTLQSSSADGDIAIMWFTAGFSGTTYAVTVTIGTNSGRVIGRTVSLPVLSLATQPVPPDAITDQTGAPLTDQTDHPITTN